jgi:hypothetical protein
MNAESLAGAEDIDNITHKTARRFLRLAQEEKP